MLRWTVISGWLMQQVVAAACEFNFTRCCFEVTAIANLPMRFTDVANVYFGWKADLILYGLPKVSIAALGLSLNRAEVALT